MIPVAQLQSAVRARITRLDRERVLPRLWEADPAVWRGGPSTPELADRLGWLSVGSLVTSELGSLRGFADQVRRDSDRVVLLGMGGSSLAAQVLWQAFGRRQGWPVFRMLDSTHPSAIRSVDADGDLANTLFIVASKSGTTIETDAFFRYFWTRCQGRGDRFVAITDPGTPLERMAQARGFRRIFRAPPDVGGRFSALSVFGVLPAMLFGVPVGRLLERAERMAHRCGPTTAIADNPGAALGASIAEAALGGRDKLTLLLPDRLGGFGLWVEQLIAESTGKNGQGILPVTDEPIGVALRHAEQRLYVAIEMGEAYQGSWRAQLGELEVRRHPLARLRLDDPYDLGAEFFRWEMATAVAGAVLGVNPFDQPNVAESKANTSQLLRGGQRFTSPVPRRADLLAFFDAVQPGDYVAVQAFLPPNEHSDQSLRRVCAALRDRLEAVVTTGYGPRYLHSTGQLHKGGPQRGHFIQIVGPVEDDVAVPGTDYTFGRLIAAQAAGDYRALVDRGRPVIRVDDPEDLLALM